MENYEQRSWLSRNWPWALPVGCCSGCLLMFVLFIGGIGATVLTVFEGIKEMSPLEEVLVVVNENENATKILGENIVSKGFPNGNISLGNDDGEVKFSIVVLGEIEEGTLYVNGIRVNKKWIYEDLYIVVKETGEQISLLKDVPIEN